MNSSGTTYCKRASNRALSKDMLAPDKVDSAQNSPKGSEYPDRNENQTAAALTFKPVAGWMFPTIEHIGKIQKGASYHHFQAIARKGECPSNEIPQSKSKTSMANAKPLR